MSDKTTKTNMVAKREPTNMATPFTLPSGVRAKFCKTHGGWEQATDLQINEAINNLPPVALEATNEREPNK